MKILQLHSTAGSCLKSESNRIPRAQSFISLLGLLEAIRSRLHELVTDRDLFWRKIHKVPYSLRPLGYGREYFLFL